MHSLVAVAPQSGVVVVAHAGVLKAFDLNGGGKLAWTRQLGEKAEESSDSRASEASVEHPRKKRKVDSDGGDGDAAVNGKAEVADEGTGDANSKKRKKQARAGPAPSPRPQDQLLATVRALEFSSDESRLLVCGDDKKVRMLSAKDGEVLGTRMTFKKPTALSLSPDNRSLLVADKFGDVITLNTGLGADGAGAADSVDAMSDDAQSALDKSPMLHRYGHLSLLTDVTFITDKLIASCDRDHKIRISCWPKTFIIENFCFGHTEYVTQLVVPKPPSSAAMTDDGDAQSTPTLLISSSADGHVRLWNYESGKELDKLNLRPSKTEFEVLISKQPSESNAAAIEEEKSSAAQASSASALAEAKSSKKRNPRVPEAPDTSFVVTAMSYSARHSKLVVITNRLKEFSLIDVDFANEKLRLLQQVPLRGKPCHIAWREFHNTQDDGDARRVKDQVWVITEPSPSRLDVHEYNAHSGAFSERADNVAFDTISDELAKDVDPSVVHLYENLNNEERFSVDRQKRYEKSQKEKAASAVRVGEIKRLTDEKDLRREKDADAKSAALAKEKAKEAEERAKQAEEKAKEAEDKAKEADGNGDAMDVEGEALVASS